MKTLLLLALSSLAFGQQTQMSINNPPPPGVVNGGGAIVGAAGQITTYYWVIARVAAGSTTPYPILVFNTVGTANFNTTNYVTLSWAPVAGATGYDVLRNTTSAYPASPTCTCAVVVNTSSNTFTDQGGALIAYPNGAPAPASAATVTWAMNNRDLDVPWVTVTTNYGGTVNVGAWIQYVIAAPSGACTNGAFPLRYVIGSSQVYACAAGTWTLISGSGGSSSGDSYVSVPFSATPVFQAVANVNTSFAITLTGNVTSSSLADATQGNTLTWRICQDATGGRTFAWPAEVVGASLIDSTASTCTTQIFLWDGTNAVALTNADAVSGSGENYLYLPGSTSGGIKFQVPAVAGSSVFTFPAGTTNFSTTGPGFVKQTGTGAAFTVATLGATDIPAVALSSGTSVTLAAPAGFYVCTSTCTVTLPVPAAGYQFCIFNGNNVSTVITLAALGSSARYENTARTAYGTAGTGTLVSGGATADKVCLLGLDSTHYLTVGYQGTWTAN